MGLLSDIYSRFFGRQAEMAFAGLIVALGNPGREYAETRHNLGWMGRDEFVADLSRSGVQVNEIKGPKAALTLWRAKINGADWLMCKPLTYMNRSGEAVGALLRFYRIEPEDMLVLHDEVDLPLGRMKLKKGGGTAGHNGLKSLAQHLGSQGFARLRLGVGKPVRGEVANYVLARFRSEEAEVLEEVVKFAAAQVYEYTRGDFDKVVARVNSFNLVKDTEKNGE